MAGKLGAIAVLIIILLTFLMIIFVSQIPYLFPKFQKLASENNLPFEPKWIIIFLIADLILIGVAAGLHKIYSNDYSKIKSVWFFSLFGGVIGALIGEQGNIVMILPYAIIMLIYAFLYKKFSWWKVTLTTYLFGIILENIVNRSPLQSPTLLWISLLTYPYFITKIWDNKNKLSLLNIIKDLKYTLIFSIVLTTAAFFLTRDNLSPPLLFISVLLPFVVKIIYKIFKRTMRNILFLKHFNSEKTAGVEIK